MNEEKGNLQNTMQFLMYSYFGDWKDDPLYAAISRAYQDATMRSAFVFPKDKNKDDKEALEIYATEIIRNEIMEYMDDKFNSKSHIKENEEAYKRGKEIFKIEELQKRVKCTDINNGDEYTNWHQKVCTELFTFYSIYSDNEGGTVVPFSYGNAQKWVNMTMKYLYLMSPLFKGNDSMTWLEKIKDKSGLFHVPLDSYILRALFFKPGATSRKYKKVSIRKQINDNYNGELIKYCSENDKDLNSVNSDGSLKKKNWGIKGDKNSVAWSNIASYKDYNEIQKKVKEQIPKGTEFESDPLSWENKVWIYASQILNV